MKVFIAVPCMDQLPARFAQSLAMLRKYDNTVVNFQIGSLVWDSRNKLAQTAIQYEADYMLWLDSDMVFGPDLLERLMKTKKESGADIVTGLYFRRNPPYTPVIYETLKLAGEGASWTEFKELPKEPVFPVEGCGFGAVLVPTDVCMSVLAKYGTMFGMVNNLGEDLSFCIRATECGYSIVCDQTIPLGHVGNMLITKEFYETYKSGRV